MLIVDPATFRALPKLNLSRIVEVRPDPKGLTRVEAKKLSADLDAIATTYSNTATGAPSGGAVGIPIRGSRFRNGLPAIITYAETLSDVVARTVAPVRIAGLAAAALLLITAGAMLARTRASELRLRVLRGVSPVAVGARVAGAAAPAIVVGVLAGFALALVGVITLGPTPELEPEPVRAALLACVVGAVAGTLLVAAVIAAISARSVDARPRHHWVRWVPWELAVVALAIALVPSPRPRRRGSTRRCGSRRAAICSRRRSRFSLWAPRWSCSHARCGGCSLAPAREDGGCRARSSWAFAGSRPMRASPCSRPSQSAS